jgi:hypothetical protein
MIYIDDCAIGSSGILHLSKAKWRKLYYISLSKIPLIKAEINLSAKT